MGHHLQKVYSGLWCGIVMDDGGGDGWKFHHFACTRENPSVGHNRFTFIFLLIILLLNNWWLTWFSKEGKWSPRHSYSHSVAAIELPGDRAQLTKMAIDEDVVVASSLGIGTEDGPETRRVYCVHSNINLFFCKFLNQTVGLGPASDDITSLIMIAQDATEKDIWRALQSTTSRRRRSAVW